MGAFSARNLIVKPLVNLFALILSGSLTGCVYGPKAERKSPLSYLNGESYANAPSGPDQMLVVMAKRKDRLTRVRGRVVSKEGLVEVPLKQTKVALLNSKREPVVVGRSDLNGEFVLSGVIPNGSYWLEAEVVKRSGSGEGATIETTSILKSLEVNSYEIDNIVLEDSGKTDLERIGP